MDYPHSQVVSISETSTFRSWIDSTENFEKFLRTLRSLWEAQRPGPCCVTVEFRSSEEQWPIAQLLMDSKSFQPSTPPIFSKEDTPNVTSLYSIFRRQDGSRSFRRLDDP